jgi:sugar lactone lactonase YvrE
VRLLSAAIWSLAIAQSAFGQTYTITTVAGGGLPVNVPAASAVLGNAPGVAIDSAGNPLVSLINYDMVVRMDAVTGELTAVAGTGTAGYSGDGGPATSAQLNNPQGIAVDKSGNLYIVDAGNAAIRKVSNGIINTIGSVGSVLLLPLVDGGFVGSSTPEGIAVDSAGNVYIADPYTNRVIKLPPGGRATTIAGTGVAGYSGDNGQAYFAELSLPSGVAVDAGGNVYIADTGNSAIRGVSSSGIITTFAGRPQTPGYNGDGIVSTTAQLNYPQDVAADAAGNVYIADTFNMRVREVTRGLIVTVAEMAAGRIAVDSSGNVFAAAYGRVYEASNGTVATVAGAGAPVGASGAATGAQLYSPVGVAVDGAGDLYIGDTDNGLLREVSNGTIASIPGQWDPWGLAVDAAGNLYEADNNLVREVTPAGDVTVVAGTGTYGYNGDNIPATSAQLNGPHAVAVDRSGNVYVVDTFNNRVRKVSGGRITTVAGTGTPGYNGDNIPANSAQLFYPEGVAVDSAGNLYIADSENLVVREVSNGLITTVAGNGTGVGDGAPATALEFSLPLGVAVDSVGNWYVADAAGSRVRKIAGGISQTIAGNGVCAFGGDGGPSAGAEVCYPHGVAAGSSGAVYVADSGNNRIRALSPSASPCAFAVSPRSFTAVPVTGGSLVVTTGTASVAHGRWRACPDGSPPPVRPHPAPAA